jgi:hypothetical protein
MFIFTPLVARNDAVLAAMYVAGLALNAVDNIANESLSTAFDNVANKVDTNYPIV